MISLNWLIWSSQQSSLNTAISPCFTDKETLTLRCWVLSGRSVFPGRLFILTFCLLPTPPPPKRLSYNQAWSHSSIRVAFPGCLGVQAHIARAALLTDIWSHTLSHPSGEEEAGTRKTQIWEAREGEVTLRRKGKSPDTEWKRCYWQWPRRELS